MMHCIHEELSNPLETKQMPIIRLETKSCRILPLTYAKKYDRT